MLSKHENWLLASWAYGKIISVHHIHFFQSLSSPVIHSSVPFSCPCLTSFVPSLTSLYFVSHPKSPVLRTSLFLVSRPLSPVSCICSLPTVRRTQSYVSVLCILSSAPCLTSLLLVSRPLYPVSLDLHIPCLTSSFLRPLTPINCPSVPFFRILTRSYKVLI